jgi:putative restriction endonuclease
MILDLAAIILLRQLATDAGFDLVDSELDGGWMRVRSSHARLVLWLRPGVGDGSLEAGLSRPDVAAALGGETGTTPETPAPGSPTAMRAVLRVPDRAGARHLLRRAFQLARALPSGPLEAFQRQIAATPPGGTEIQRLAVQRIGQQHFRTALMEFWNGRCAISGLDVPALLRASHARPWAECDNDADRLDVFNGLLLAAHLDAAFDSGLIAIAEDGTVMVSLLLSPAARATLGLAEPRRIGGLLPGHVRFLTWHRLKVWQDRSGA